MTEPVEFGGGKGPSAAFAGLGVSGVSFRCSRKSAPCKVPPAETVSLIPVPDTDILRATPENIDAAAALLRAGKLVAFPTETVYGLGADATDDKAVASIFAAKDRPRFNPLILHFPDIALVGQAVNLSETALKLAEAFWPGALTLVLPRWERNGVSLLASAGLDTLAVRIPAHPVAHALLEAAHVPVAAPSANRSMAVSPTRAAHVAESLGGRVDAILDGGACQVGLESTVIDLSSERPTLLRPGGIAAEAIEAVIGPLAAAGEGGAPKSPGMMRRHYAPVTPVRLNAREVRDGEVLLGFGPGAPEGAANLSASGDLAEAAANLFAMMRELDGEGATGLAVMPIPDVGLGRAINDRLKRAATPVVV